MQLKSSEKRFVGPTSTLAFLLYMPSPKRKLFNSSFTSVHIRLLYSWLNKLSWRTAAVKITSIDYVFTDMSFPDSFSGIPWISVVSPAQLTASFKGSGEAAISGLSTLLSVQLLIQIYLVFFLSHLQTHWHICLCASKSVSVCFMEIHPLKVQGKQQNTLCHFLALLTFY